MRRRLSTLCLTVALIVLAGLSIVPAVRAAPFAQQDETVTIYFFWGDGCPHCAEAEPFLEDLTRRYPGVQVEAFEVWYDDDNRELFSRMAAAYGFEPRYVPTIFIGDAYWQGFSDPLRTEIEMAVQACLAQTCRDAGAGIVPGHEQAPIVAGPSEAGSLMAPVTIFWGDIGCEQCEATESHHEVLSGYPHLGADAGGQALSFLRDLEARYPGVEVTAYEVYLASANAATFEEVAASFGVEARGVPTIFIGDRVWEGFDDTIAAQVSDYVQACLDTGCASSQGEAAAIVPGVSVGPADGATEAGSALSAVPKANTIDVPILGTLDLGAQSLWVGTAVISFVDGFNPCSLWVLSILIALTLRTGSRKRIFAIGLIYITVTAAVYILFIAGLFTFLNVVEFLGWIQVAVSVLALFFAVVNIKDYFWYKEGISFTIADERKPGIYKRIRKVLNAGDSFWALAGATVGLGAGVSLVEFSCTAGFPVIWTNMMAAQNVRPLTFILLLLLYMMIYQIDELVIFGVAVATLKTSRLEEKHGRMLKLEGGTLMLTLAAVMLINPALMNDLGSSLLIFGAAVAAAGLVLVIHRRVLPRLGIYIGTELTPSGE